MTADDEESEGHRLPGHLSHLRWSKFYRYICDEYGFPDEWAVQDLVEALTDPAFRGEPEAPFVDREQQRREVHHAAIAIKVHSGAVIRETQLLRAALAGFQRAISVEGHWSGAMLQEVFDIEDIKPTAVNLPDELSPLGGPASDELVFIARALAIARELEKLPVRPRLRSNKVRNYALDRALRACRHAWQTSSPNRSWSRGSLRHSPGGPSGQLSKPCERFVDDMLTACGFKYTYAELNGAWTGLETRDRRASHQNP